MSGNRTLTESARVLVSEPMYNGLIYWNSDLLKGGISGMLRRNQESICIRGGIWAQRVGCRLVIVCVVRWCAVMKNPNRQKEEFSYAYVHAVASHAGFFCEKRLVDINSVDVTIRSDHYVSAESKMCPVIDFQLKATSTHDFNNGDLSFPLKVKNYHELRGEASVPILLIVFLIPKNVRDWLEHSEEQLITRKCAYWCNLKGFPGMGNTDEVTVHIAQKNLFSPGSLKELMLRASKNDGMGVGYEV